MSSRAERRPGEPDKELQSINPDTAERILSFLQTAPEEIAEWASAQEAAVRRASATRETVAEPAPREQHPDDILLAELGEEDDDIVTSRPKPRGRKHRPTLSQDATGDATTAAVASASTAARTTRAASGPTNPKYLKKRTSSGGKIALALIFAFAVVFAIYLAGKPTPEATQPANHPTMGEQQQAPSAAERAERIAQLQSQIEADPSDTKARLELGVLQFNQRETAKAEEQWTSVIEADPSEVQAWYNLGFLYLSKDPAEEDKAREAWGKVVELAPDSDLARTAQMHLGGLNDGKE